MSWQISDIPTDIFVIDLEWVGSGTAAQLTEVAVLCVGTAEVFHYRCASLCSANAKENIRLQMSTCESTADILTPFELFSSLIVWVDANRSMKSAVHFIAHNGVRYDSTVLLANMQRCNVLVPMEWYMLDSLAHARYHARYREKMNGFDLSSLCTHFEVDSDADQRHGALYDVRLLHSMLQALASAWDVPYISGHAHFMQVVSPMVVHGIGPTICDNLGYSDLADMCRDILSVSGNLTPSSCMTFLEANCIQSRVPLANLAAIADSVERAAIRHLHYIA
tara:strand:+ start:683 stop:1519 length:837 start_codon:yes stop_codon:yes gene_type:complete